MFKATFSILIGILLSFSAFSQSIADRKKLETEQAKVIEAQDSINRDLFIDSIFGKNYHLKLVWSFKVGQMWRNAHGKDSGIVDFRELVLKFPTNNDALLFHYNFLPANSEYATPEPGEFDIPGTEELKIYRNNPLLDSFLIQHHLQMHFFLFVVDNYMIKLFFTCKDNVPLSTVSLFAVEAVRKIKTAKR